MTQFYLAPMEEVTGYVYRNVYHAMFGDMDRYFTPFIAPTKKKILKTRERKEVAPENNQGMNVVPQILTNDTEQFLDTCNMLIGLGYHEVNLNLGSLAAIADKVIRIVDGEIIDIEDRRNPDAKENRNETME